MWLLATLALGSFLAWFITAIVLQIVRFLCIHILRIPPYVLDLPLYLMKRYHAPMGYAILVSYLPNLVLVILYLMWLPAQNDRFKHWPGWNYFRGVFFPIIPIFACKDSDKKVILYVSAPHGVYPVGVIFGIILNPAYAHVRVAVTSILFWIPIVREFASMAGCVEANSKDIVHLLENNTSVLVTPEGLRSILHYNEPAGVMAVLKGIPGECDARRGYVRCAVGTKNHNEVVIVPVYTKGERDLYSVISWQPLQWLQRKMLDRFRYPFPVLAFGWWCLPFWPKPSPLVMRFGTPISLVCGDSTRDVDDIHKEVCNQLETLSK